MQLERSSYVSTSHSSWQLLTQLSLVNSVEVSLWESVILTWNACAPAPNKVERNTSRLFSLKTRGYFLPKPLLPGISFSCRLKTFIIRPKSPASASSRTIMSSLFSINEEMYCITLLVKDSNAHLLRCWVREFRNSSCETIVWEDRSRWYSRRGIWHPAYWPTGLSSVLLSVRRTLTGLNIKVQDRLFNLHLTSVNLGELALSNFSPDLEVWQCIM